MFPIRNDQSNLAVNALQKILWVPELSVIYDVFSVGVKNKILGFKRSQTFFYSQVFNKRWCTHLYIS